MDRPSFGSLPREAEQLRNDMQVLRDRTLRLVWALGMSCDALAEQLQHQSRERPSTEETLLLAKKLQTQAELCRDFHERLAALR